jgi:hypothetical protein
MSTPATWFWFRLESISDALTNTVDVCISYGRVEAQLVEDVE